MRGEEKRKKRKSREKIDRVSELTWHGSLTMHTQRTCFTQLFPRNSTTYFDNEMSSNEQSRPTLGFPFSFVGVKNRCCYLTESLHGVASGRGKYFSVVFSDLVKYKSLLSAGT